MKGLQKLRIAVMTLFLLMVLGIIISLVVITIEENEVSDAYQSLSYDDRQVVTGFYDKLPDYNNIYTVIGFAYYAVTIGLFLLLSKIWYLKKI